MHLNRDSDIIALFSVNREEGFSLMLTLYREKLYYHIRRILILHEDTDDALQNTFIKVWGNLDKFKSDSSLYTWLYRIATNEALSILRKRDRQKLIEEGGLENLLNNAMESDTWFDGDEAFKKLCNAIISLPEKQQLVFNMRYFDNMKYDEISEILETSVGALKANYHHARKKIEEYLHSN